VIHPLGFPIPRKTNPVNHSTSLRCHA
jgi:hypothetical protein